MQDLVDGFVKEKERLLKEKEEQDQNIRELQSQLDDLNRLKDERQSQLAQKIQELEKNLTEEKTNRKS